jgi:hypothetical protein
MIISADTAYKAFCIDLTRMTFMKATLYLPEPRSMQINRLYTETKTSTLTQKCFDQSAG